MLDIKKIYQICKGHTVHILTHNFPDADATFSSRGLQYLLELEGINADICYHGSIQRVNLIRAIEMYHVELSQISDTFDESDYIIYVDCQPGESNVTPCGGKIVACIDHHPLSNNCRYEYQYVHECGACSTHIVECLMTLENVPSNVLTGLFYGLRSDTLSFSRGVTDLDIDAFKYLNSRVDMESIKLLESCNMQLSDLKAFGSVIQNITTIADIGISHVPFECPDGLIAMLAEFMLSVDDICITAIFSYRDSGVKVSVRSIIPFVHAGTFTKNALLQLGGNGGGHSMFAGGFIPRECVDSYSQEEFTKLLTESFFNQYSECIKNSI